MINSDNKPGSEDARYEIFVERFAHFEPDLRRFIRSLLPTWTDTDDVLQQTALVIWRKFDQYDPDTNFMKWACVIARFEALAYRRTMARDRLVFSEELVEMMADEGVEELDARKAEIDALKTCLRSMPEKHSQFLKLAYTQGVKIKELAEEAGSSPAAFYMKLKRLRQKLMQCLEGNIAEVEGNLNR